MWQAVALAFGLAMDSTAVSAARGLAKRPGYEQLLLPLVFGGFQAAMAGGGWVLGHEAGPYIAAYQGYVAFVLLGGIGAKMLVDAWHGTAADPDARSGALLYLALGVATSIDAAAAGLTLPLVPVQPWVALALIGGITAACSAAGFRLGRVAGARLGSRLEILGGAVLIGIGVKMLIQGW
jgi:putative Mn2+ efflux pump MntP